MSLRTAECTDSAPHFTEWTPLATAGPDLSRTPFEHFYLRNSLQFQLETALLCCALLLSLLPSSSPPTFPHLQYFPLHESLTTLSLPFEDVPTLFGLLSTWRQGIVQIEADVSIHELKARIALALDRRPYTYRRVSRCVTVQARVMAPITKVSWLVQHTLHYLANLPTILLQ